MTTLATEAHQPVLRAGAIFFALLPFFLLFKKRIASWLKKRKGKKASLISKEEPSPLPPITQGYMAEMARQERKEKATLCRETKPARPN